MISNTYLIGKHLQLPTGAFPIKSCALCGITNVPGFKKREVISSSFMDYDLLGAGEYICQYCAACLGKGQPRSEWMRLTSFIASESQLLRLKREEIWQYIFKPPLPPFVFGVTYSHKKHISFKAPINLSCESYQIQTDEGSVKICPERIRALTEIIQKWYSICRDTKTEPTWFTKSDILYGCSNYKRIEEYGIMPYLEENQEIEPYRHTALLKLLVHILNKGNKRSKGDLHK